MVAVTSAGSYEHLLFQISPQNRFNPILVIFGDIRINQIQRRGRVTYELPSLP